MLPDFPKQKKELMKFWNDFGIKKQKEYSGIFSNIPTYQNHEGDKWVLHRRDGTESVSNYKEAGSTFSLSFDEVPNLTPNDIANKLDLVAKEMADQMEKHFFQTLFEETRHNSPIPSEDGNFTEETLLKLLDSILISFNNEHPNLPVLFVSPEIGRTIKDKLKSWNDSKELQKRFDAIIERKREEWRDRESYRKLVE